MSVLNDTIFLGYLYLLILFFRCNLNCESFSYYLLERTVVTGLGHVIALSRSSEKRKKDNKKITRGTFVNRKKDFNASNFSSKIQAL